MFKAVSRIIRMCGPLKPRFYWGCVFAFFTSMFTAMPIMGVGYILNLILQAEQGGFKLTPVWSLYALVFMVVMVLGRFLFSYLQASFQESIVYELTSGERMKIGDILRRVSLGFFQKNRVGDITAAITTDLSFVEMYAMKMVTKVVNGYISVAAMLICVGFFSLMVACVALAGVLVSGLFLALISKSAKRNGIIHQQTIDDSTSATLEYIRGIAVVKAYGRKGAAVSEINRAYKNAKDINIKIERNYVGCNVMHLMALKLASVGMVLVAAGLCIAGSMPVHIFMMMSVYSFSVLALVESVNNAAHVLENENVILDKLDAIKSAQFIDEGAKDVELTQFGISMQNVTFAYDKRDVLKDVSFTIPPNTTTAIVGPSGGGKSTVCNLIVRFYDADTGSVQVGGVDVRNMSCDSLLANISMVFQNVYLFCDSIANNIRFGKSDATMDEIMTAAKAARCHDFIMELPQGYDTIVGEGGSSLSGGEKQRISIARAILKNAPIIILDEATASVDPENEHHIQQAISALTSGKTIVAIAHRLATIEHADQILVVDDGEIAQRGTHSELIAQSGIYSNFIELRRKAAEWQLQTQESK